MTDPLAAPELLRQITDRILRLRDEEDALKADIREVYAEAKSQGFDKTIVGKIVARIRAEAKDGDKLAEQEELVDLYLRAYQGASRASAHTHARARTAAPASVSASLPPHDPETGEVVEPAPATVAAAPAFLTGERKVLRPNCQRPDNCGGYGSNHCHDCKTAVEGREAA